MRQAKPKVIAQGDGVRRDLAANSSCDSWSDEGITSTGGDHHGSTCQDRCKKKIMLNNGNDKQVVHGVIAQSDVGQSKVENRKNSDLPTSEAADDKGETHQGSAFRSTNARSPVPNTGSDKPVKQTWPEAIAQSDAERRKMTASPGGNPLGNDRATKAGRTHHGSARRGTDKSKPIFCNGSDKQTVPKGIPNTHVKGDYLIRRTVWMRVRQRHT